MADASRIRAALDDVLSGQAHRRAARRLADAMADAPTPDEILESTVGPARPDKFRPVSPSLPVSRSGEPGGP
jgi:hypothetical protein